MSQENGRTARQRGNSLGTEAGIEDVSGNDCRLFGGHRKRARTMHAAQHLSERQVERAQARLSRWRFTVVFVILCMAMMTKRFTRVRRAAAGMPCRMRKRALLCNEQQRYANT